MEPLAVTRMGHGPPVVLIHGGVGPEITWERQRPLADRWSLIIPWRRGFPPSPRSERQDFEADADDITGLLGSGSHLVGFSYGGVGAAVSAARCPERVRSLTLIETPLFAIARGDPDVAALEDLSGRALGMGAEREEGAWELFSSLAGLGSPEHEAERGRVRDLAAGLRPPGEAAPDYHAITEAGLPVLVGSGGHNAGIERLCDVLSERLRARRFRIDRAGHAVQRATGFNAEFERFLRDAERAAGADIGPAD